MRILILVPALYFLARVNSYYDDGQRIKGCILVENKFLSRFFITRTIAHYHNGKVKKEHYNKLSYVGLAGYILTLLYALTAVFSLSIFGEYTAVLLNKTLFYLALSVGALIMLLYFLNDGEVWKKGIVAKAAAIFCDGILAFSVVYLMRWVIAFYKLLYMMKF